MIPYFVSPSLSLPFGLQITAFGVIMAISILLGSYLLQKTVLTYGPGDDRPMMGLPSWAVVGGMAGGHLLHVFGYHPELLREVGPVVIIQFWEGLSSMGGVLGGLIGIFLFLWKNHVPATPYLDPLALSAAPGWAVARIGCFLVHDHPGVRSDFFLAVRFPGGARHDLGLYDFFVLTALSIVLWRLARVRRPMGMLMGILAMGYSAPRFFLDFLRATDLPQSDGRYAGLTPAQYIVPVLFLIGVVLVVRSFRVGVQIFAPPEPAPVSVEPASPAPAEKADPNQGQPV